MTRRASAQAALLVLAASLSVNLGAALGKGLFAAVGPEGVAALRNGFAALVLWLLVRPWRTPAGGPLARAQIGWLAVFGLVLGLMNLTIYLAFARIPIGLAVAIEIAGPLLLVLSLSRRPRDFLWLALAVAGLALLIPMPALGLASDLDPLGVFFAAVAGLCWALYIVLGKRVSGLGSGRVVAVGTAFACLVTLPLGVAHAGAGLLAPPVLALGLGVALLSGTLPYVLEIRALAHFDARVFGLVTSCGPAVAALAGFAVLGERLTGPQWLAVALMIGASAGTALTAGSRQPEPVPPKSPPV